jgi:hypothetical protein
MVRGEAIMTTANPGRFAVSALLCVFACTEITLADPPERTVQFDKDRHYLYRVTDFTRLTTGGGEKDSDHEAYCDLILHAHSFTPDTLNAAARKDVAYANLMAADDRLREDVRFELVRFEGRLKRLKRIGSYDKLRDGGIPQLYEAWIFPTDTAKPLSIHLTDLPADIEPELDINPGKLVRVTGYFFKVVRYQSEEANPSNPNQNLIRQAPLLIGRSLELNATPTLEERPSGVMLVLPVLFVGVGIVIVGIIGMAIWLRRTDAGLRSHTARSIENPFGNPADEPKAG